ncbi:MAG: ester cyclase [Flavisolibacter sp.]
MKKPLFLSALGIIIAFSSCNHFNRAVNGDSSNSSDSSKTSMDERNRNNTVSVFRGIESGDLSKMDDFASKDLVDHTTMGDVKGLDSVKKMLGDIHNHISNLKFDLISDASNGDYHFIMGKMTGTTKDNWMGMPANTSINETFTGVEKMSNGKITDHWRFVDPAEMMKAMGTQQHGKDN